ncbi:MAG: CPBP family intramembrane metalloprotease [Oscillospiraceae bacterium]|mgnify:FL=1|jgi:membrane protease YdiL (CAAX protease family)|nr:CPBP family intramembrane metalloprotease [Oscillospiraceae bacterium]MCI8943610.1 CPBP family intramembrane metalloprotease [Oscillospiraceae bacterium]
MGDGKRQMRLYLISVLGICWVLGIAAAFSRGNVIYQILQKGFTAFPVIAAVLTRRITKDKAQWRISLKVWKDNRLWAFCAFVPGILIAVGAALYFMLFPEQYSGIFHLGNLTGTERVLQITNPLQFGLICILIAAVCIPVQLLELGEEIGWREYLLPKQISMYGARKGILLNGLFWGTAHLPLIFLGFNYSPENVGAPWSNMLMMMLVCMTIGVICSWVMVRSNNVMYSAIVHGVVNVIGEIPVFLSISGKSGLLGPNPTGLVSMSGLMLCAAALFIWLPGVKNGKAEMAGLRAVQK